jgi:hypothetical protein
MDMKKSLLVLVLCGMELLPAQAPANETKVVELKYIDFRAANAGGMLNAFQLQVNGYGQTVVLHGAPASVAAAEAFLRKLDVRPKNVEASFYILAASVKPGGSQSMPSELEPVIKQIRNAFAYQSFRLLETAVVRARENGGAVASGNLPVAAPDASMQRTYNLTIDRVRVSPAEKGDIVRFDTMRFQVLSPDIVRTNVTKKPEFTTAGVTADIDVREGQKVVVGKSNFDGVDGTFFLIVTAKIVD